MDIMILAGGCGCPIYTSYSHNYDGTHGVRLCAVIPTEYRNPGLVFPDDGVPLLAAVVTAPKLFLDERVCLWLQHNRWDYSPRL